MKELSDSSFSTANAAVRRLVIVTSILACAAPIVTLAPRVPDLTVERMPMFQYLFAFNDHVQSLAMLAALVLALACPPLRAAAEHLAAWIGERPAQTALLSFVALALGACFIYRAHPLSMDEYAPWMQAHAFAKLSGLQHYPAELLDRIVPPNTQGSFVFVDHASGATTSGYWPGLALLLTPLVFADLGWCLNPAFGALSLWLLHRLASDGAGDVRAGGWAVLAALASPQFGVSAMSWYAMSGELALNLLYLWLLLQPRRSSALIAGLVGGLTLIMHNPVPHMLLAAPCLVWLMVDRSRWSRLVYILVGYLPLGVGVGLGWWVLIAGFTGAVPHSPPALHGGSALDALRQVLVWPDPWLWNARWIASWKVWIWASPGLILLASMPRSRPLSERLLLAGFVLTFVFHLFVRFDQGHGWGYRYIHPVWAWLPLAAGLWLARAQGWARRFGTATLAAGLMATPVFLWQTQSTIDNALSSRLTPDGPGDWVIFMAPATYRARAVLVQNAEYPSPMLYLRSLGEHADRALMTRYYPEAIEVKQDSRGSAWHLPPGRLSAKPSQH